MRSPGRALSSGWTAAVDQAQPPCLLLVDDQPINIQALYRVFAEDHRVLMATSGEKALALCRESPPDLVLLDVVMPAMDGYEVARQLRADPSTAGIPLIFVTARDDADEEARGLALGAVDFIAKPINPAVVRARVRTHLELARSRALLEATLEATADGIVVADTRGAFVTCNERFVTLWGLQPQVLAEGGSTAVLRFMQSQMKDDQTDLQSLMDMAGATGEEIASTVELRDGRIFERHLTPLRTSGRITGHVFSFRDITERLTAERALADLNASLEFKVRQRTEALAHASRVASSANQAKSEFLSNMSHEMRTPMNSVLGLSYLALRADPSPKVRDYLERISESGEHLLGLISNVLDFSKIEAGKIDLEEVDFLATDVVDDVLKALRSTAAAKGLPIEADVDRAFGHPLRGDPLRIRQVLLNFIGNAVKFSSRGSIRLRARVQSDDTGTSWARFEVQDEGIGMTDAQAARLFTPFEQADASTTRQYGGTGLGLAICRQLAHLMGGEVGVDSQPGVGSTFWFRVPLVWGDSLQASLLGDLPDADPVSVRLDGARVLVVDDNPLNQRVAMELLQSVGAEAWTAGDGLEALQWLASHRVDLVLMDVQMPRMDGLETVRRLRTDATHAQLRVIAMTANARREDQTACLAAGMDDYVTKPIKPAEFFITVARWLGRWSSAEGATPAASSGAASFGAAAPASPSTAALSDSPRRGPDVSAAATPAEPADAEVDPSTLRNLTRGNVRVMNDIVEVFVQLMERSMGEMGAALSEGQPAPLAALGHKLKSSAASVGAPGLSRLCHQLEQSMKVPGASVDEARSLVERIAAATPAVRTQLKALTSA